MVPELDRFLLSMLIFSGFALAAIGTGAWVRRTVCRRGNGRVAGHTGFPTLLYFWSEHCSLCPYQGQQIEDAVRTLAQSGNQLLVRKINAVEEASLARSLNVLTVPTTVLVAPGGDVLAWNPGLCSARTIVSQLTSVHPAH